MPKTNQPRASDTAKWIGIAGAGIGVLTLLWTIASHFIPRAEAPEVLRRNAASAPSSSEVKMFGSGNIAIGQVSGGSVIIGSTPTSPPSAPASVKSQNR
jgi:hypothetical protein